MEIIKFWKDWKLIALPILTINDDLINKFGRK